MMPKTTQKSVPKKKHKLYYWPIDFEVNCHLKDKAEKKKKKKKRA
jgi:hypothetical protein